MQRVLCQVTVVRSGVTALMGNNGKIFLVSNTDITIQANTHLGGLGGGQFQAQDLSRDELLLNYDFPKGVPALATCARMV